MKNIGLFLKSLFYSGNLNIENMQGTGFSWLLGEHAKKNGIELTDKILRDETGYFNTHPFFINFIIGVWFKEFGTPEGPDYWKKVYSSAFAAVGDSVFYHSYRVFCFTMAALSGFYNILLGLFVYLLLYNIPHFYFLFCGYDIGFKYGKNLILWFNRFKVNQWGQFFDMISLFFIGFFLSVMISVNSFTSIWHYFLGAVMLFMGLSLARILNVGIAFIIAVIGFGIILLLGGL